MRRSRKHIGVSGTLSFKKTDTEFLGSDRIALLEKIDECGSITKAAKAVGISYKTAWDIINAVNNLSEKPLCIPMAGGKSGGGTCLTDEGREIIRKFRMIQEEHEKYLSNLEDKIDDVDMTGLYTFLKRISMKVSARNIFSGKVVKIVRGEVRSEVTVSTKGGALVVGTITNDSVAALGLIEGSSVYAIVKANSVIIGPAGEDIKVSIRNRLPGTVVSLTRDTVNTELNIELSGGNMISAVITNECSQDLGLKTRDQVCVMFKASSVILGTD